MTAWRFPRLEALLGARWDRVTYRQVAGIVDVPAPAASDLQLRGEPYQVVDTAGGPAADAEDAEIAEIADNAGAARERARRGEARERGRDALARDVAALANSAGGLLVVGIAADSQGQAATVVPVPVSTGDLRWMDTVLATRVFPRPLTQARIVADPDDRGRGFLLIAVAASASGPHAVAGAGGTLTFPRRSGPTTVNLSEQEVAQAYRRRFADLDARENDLADLDDVHGQIRTLLHRSAPDGARVTVSLLPDIPGAHPVTAASHHAFTTEVTGQVPFIGARDRNTWTAHTLRPGRFIAHGGAGGEPREPVCILHSTGAGSIAVRVRATPALTDASRQISDEDVVDAVLSGLRFLARHARDRTGTGGTATIRAQIETASGDLRLAHFSPWVDQLGDAVLSHFPSSTGRADIDDLAEDGPRLVAATHYLTALLFQEFGYAEPAQTSGDGRIRLAGWATWRTEYLVWAKEFGIPVDTRARTADHG